MDDFGSILIQQDGQSFAFVLRGCDATLRCLHDRRNQTLALNAFAFEEWGGLPTAMDCVMIDGLPRQLRLIHKRRPDNSSAPIVFSYSREV